MRISDWSSDVCSSDLWLPWRFPMGGSIAGAPEIAAPYNLRVGMPMIRFPPFLSREYALACQAKNGPALSHGPSMLAGGTSCGDLPAKQTPLPKFSLCKNISLVLRTQAIRQQALESLPGRHRVLRRELQRNYHS